VNQNKKLVVPSVSFRCWSRKKYAVFNSLKKVIKICTLCLAYNLVSLTAKAQSEKGTDTLLIKSIELGEVVVTAGRTPIEMQQTARLVTVLTKPEIERAPAQNLNDLLRFIAGVDLRQRGPLGAQADISIRGGTYDQTLILLNGVNVTDPQTGHHNLNIPVDIESIEQIEILKGPAAKSFGPNAFNGAVNIITGNSSSNHIRASGMYGRYGLYKASANISNSIGNFRHFLGVSNSSSDGYIDNTDFKNTDMFYQAKYSLKSGIFDFQTGYKTKDFGANSFYSLKYPNQFESTKTQFASLKFQSNTLIKFAPAIYFRRNLDHFELIRNNDIVPFNNHKTNTAGLNLNAYTTHRFGKTSLGIDFRNEYIISNVLGYPLNNPIEVPGYDNTFYTKYYNRFNTSIYAEHTFALENFSAAAGIMAHHNSDLSGFRFYPGIDLNYRINNYFSLFSSANKTLRMPTFTDMFYKSPVQQGNPGLKPEEATSIEGGIKYNSSNINGSVSAFRRWGYNMIDWVKDISPDSLIWRSMNHAQINLSGLEFSVMVIPAGENNFTRIQSIIISCEFLKADSSSNNMLSKYALDYLNSQVTASIDFRIGWKLYNSFRLTFNDRHGSYQDVTGKIVPYDSFWLSDTKLYWKESHFTVYAEASNLFNTEYYDFGGIVQPGIWFRGGILLDLDYKK
jgi:vitamin B12 transporter